MGRPLQQFQLEAVLLTTAFNAILSGFRWLEARGINKDRIGRLLYLAESEGRDVSEGEVNQELEIVQANLDATLSKLGDDPDSKPAPEPVEDVAGADAGQT